ncbi:MAG TPA: hypothetical protein VIB39_02935 [Candidatus Angelobacter sp.]
MSVVLFTPGLLIVKLPAPLLAVVSTVMGPIGDGLRPSIRNMMERNESAVADGVGVGVGLGFGVGLGLGFGVGLGTGVGVGVGPGVLLETVPQPEKMKMKIPENKTRITLRKKSLPKAGMAY